MSSHFVPALQKGIAIMRLISERRGPSTTKAIAKSLDLPHSTAYRLIQTFVAADWVRPVDGGEHEISYGLLPLLQPLVHNELLIENVRESLVRLSRESGLTTKLSVRQGNSAITVFRVESPRPTSIAVRIGSPFHLTLGSSGTVLLSSLSEHEKKQIIQDAPSEAWSFQKKNDIYRRLEEFEKRGICEDPGKYRPTTHAISTALRDRSGIILAALTIIGFREDFAKGRRETLRKQLIATSKICDEVLSGNVTFVNHKCP